mgnify:CR=1 FL=1
MPLAVIQPKAQESLPICYKGMNLDAGYRLDILVPGQLILELKAVDMLMPIHTAQMITYLKLTGVHTGLLINFNVRKLTDGIKRVVLLIFTTEGLLYRRGHRQHRG